MLALVWVAGPISGALVQPYVGIRSDNCRISWGKRKPFMIGGGAATIISLLILGWTKEICAWILPDGSEFLPKLTIMLAVLMIYVLDFAINTGMPMFLSDLTSMWRSRELMDNGYIQCKPASAPSSSTMPHPTSKTPQTPGPAE